VLVTYLEFRYKRSGQRLCRRPPLHRQLCRWPQLPSKPGRRVSLRDRRLTAVEDAVPGQMRSRRQHMEDRERGSARLCPVSRHGRPTVGLRHRETGHAGRSRLLSRSRSGTDRQPVPPVIVIRSMSGPSVPDVRDIDRLGGAQKDGDGRVGLVRRTSQSEWKS
jgi:hypothetical protein